MFHNKQLFQVEERTGFFLFFSLSHPASSLKLLGKGFGICHSCADLGLRETVKIP